MAYRKWTRSKADALACWPILGGWSFNPSRLMNITRAVAPGKADTWSRARRNRSAERVLPRSAQRAKKNGRRPYPSAGPESRQARSGKDTLETASHSGSEAAAPRAGGGKNALALHTMSLGGAIEARPSSGTKRSARLWWRARSCFATHFRCLVPSPFAYVSRFSVLFLLLEWAFIDLLQPRVRPFSLLFIIAFLRSLKDARLSEG